MNKKRILTVVICLALVICLSMILYIISFKVNSFNKGFYRAEFDKYNVYGSLYGKDVEKINSEVLDYIRGKSDKLDADFFAENEIEHFKDVRSTINRVNLAYYLLLAASFLLVISLSMIDKRNFLRNISKTLFYAGLFSILAAALIAIIIIVGFDFAFTIFHKIFFPQGGWLFNASDNIIRLYPSGLFYDIAKKIFTGVLMYGGFLIGAGILVKYLNKGKNN